MAVSRAITARQPMSPSSSPQTEKMKSVHRLGREPGSLLWVWVPCIYPCPKMPPDPMASRLRVCCQPVSSAS